MKFLYQGRHWDAPAMDNVRRGDLTGRTCSWCDEEVAPEDDAVQLGMCFHTECWLRTGLGDVPHLEGRCWCCGGSETDNEGTSREQAQRTLAWLIEHRRGGWRD